MDVQRQRVRGEAEQLKRRRDRVGCGAIESVREGPGRQRGGDGGGEGGGEAVDYGCGGEERQVDDASEVRLVGA